MNAHALNDSSFKYLGMMPGTKYVYKSYLRKLLYMACNRTGLVGPAHTTRPTPIIRAQSVPVNPIIIMLPNSNLEGRRVLSSLSLYSIVFHEYSAFDAWSWRNILTYITPFHSNFQIVHIKINVVPSESASEIKLMYLSTISANIVASIFLNYDNWSLQDVMRSFLIHLS